MIGIQVINTSFFVFNLIYFSIERSIILFSIFLILALSTSFFIASLSLLKLTETGTNLSTFNLYTSLFKLLQLVGAFFIYQYLIYLHQILS